MLNADCICDGFYSGSLLQGEHYLGKREPEPAGRHTEGVWSPGRRKRSTQPGWIRKGGIPWTYNIKNLLAPSTRWTPRPTSALHFTSLMDPSINMKRTELGPWGRLNKRNADQSRLEICQKIYTTEDFRVNNLHRKRVIFDIC